MGVELTDLGARRRLTLWMLVGNRFVARDANRF
jgi:hypothetical protein